MVILLIDWNKTFKKTNLSKEYFDKFPKSNKKVWAICNNCDKGRWIVFAAYSKLCLKCSLNPPKPKFVKEEDRFLKNTMIDRILTIEKFGYDPIDLSKGSGKRVIVKCRKCNKIRIIAFQVYRDLCVSCVQIGKKASKETRQKMSDNAPHISGKDHWNYGKSPSIKVREKLSKSMKNKHKGENNPMFGTKGDKCPSYGKKQTKLHKIRNSCSKQGIDIKDFDGFIGRHPNRKYVIVEENCIKLNIKIKTFEAHHIMSGVVIYIPKYIHRSISHNMKTGKGMEEINKLAFNYLMGDI
jgi:hypothetical protein